MPSFSFLAPLQVVWQFVRPALSVGHRHHRCPLATIVRPPCIVVQLPLEHYSAATSTSAQLPLGRCSVVRSANFHCSARNAPLFRRHLSLFSRHFSRCSGILRYCSDFVCSAAVSVIVWPLCRTSTLVIYPPAFRVSVSDALVYAGHVDSEAFSWVDWIMPLLPS